MQARATRAVRVGSLSIGSDNPVVVQSMCATRTQDIDATVRQAESLREAGAGLVRIAIDNERDARALIEVRRQTKANLVVDLQENYRLAELVAPSVDKIRYNPGHLHHLEREKSVFDKVAWLVAVAGAHDCAIRIGVNCGSVDPQVRQRYGADSVAAIVASACEHCAYMDQLHFDRYVVSLKDSDPMKVIEANIRFARQRPDVALHLGVTEAGLPPDGIIKTRVAFEKLLTRGLGDTLRVSLTLPFERKYEEVQAGFQILRDIEAGRFISVPDFGKGLNIISCPSCSRVENERFVELAEQVKDLAAYAKSHDITIAVMGCRVNGPGETDDADLGLWCGPTTVNFKRKGVALGSYAYDQILSRLKSELDKLITPATA